MTENNSIDDSMVEVRCYFVRHKNALAVRANFSQIYMDHYIHLLENQIKTDQLNDQNLKDALAGCALHLASRPWDEVSAWTIHFSNPLINIFVTGNSNERNLIGRIFINHENHFMVQGKRQLGFLYNDFINATVDKDQLKSIVQSAILYSLDFDLLVPSYDLVKEVSVDQVRLVSDTLKLRTGKRLGFVFEKNNDEVEG